MASILTYLERWTDRDKSKQFYNFVDRRGNVVDSHTYESFGLRARFLARWLQAEAGLRNHDRVLLAYPPRAEFLVAVIACVRPGAIPGPVPPPNAARLSTNLDRMVTVASDCGATIGLTQSSLGLDHSFNSCSRRAVSRWIQTDQLRV